MIREVCDTQLFFVAEIHFEMGKFYQGIFLDLMSSLINCPEYSFQLKIASFYQSCPKLRKYQLLMTLLKNFDQKV